MNRLHAFIDTNRPLIEAELDRRLPRAELPPENLHEAMRYAVLGGGKRLRGLLCMMGAQACGGEPGQAIGPAAAVECLHAYSLVHDDLPCMDDAEMRRGKLSCHKAFGETLAVLVGDGLQASAFEILSNSLPPAPAGRACAVLAEAVGSRGMVGGQVLDLEGERKDLPVEQIEAVDRWKTGALIAASCRLGGIAGGADDDCQKQLTRYGFLLGLVYQITDDLLDIEADPATIGKSTGQDQRLGKSTYPAALGVEPARALARDMATEARDALKAFGREALMLRLMSDFVLQRGA